MEEAELMIRDKNGKYYANRRRVCGEYFDPTALN